MTKCTPLPALVHRIRSDQSGASLIEFALGLPLLLTAGLYATELAHLAITHQRISQLALELADNASRVGLYTNQSTVQIREADVNDVLAQTRYRGASLNLTENGRVTLSSLENIGGTQVIHWQRCIGKKNGAGFDSTYGTTTTTAGTTTSSSNAGTPAPNGMGPSGSQVNAPNNSGVMFVEINYEYKPLLVSGWFVKTQQIHYIASYIVRDNRDFSMIFNPSPAATRATCNLYTD
ncbi:MAG: histidine kinase [Alphaproteobacteria bacterium HGW-Alphaproteobacteria-16]|nr:MAG: histidine kinase [Alphaproteobacteria bacterium HGW-Alphaproteobacteria-16]